jgi:copper chaperone CopZ
MGSTVLSRMSVRRSSTPIEKVVAHLPGVSSVIADDGDSRADLEFDPTVTSVERIVAALQDEGYILGRDWFALA